MRWLLPAEGRRWRAVVFGLIGAAVGVALVLGGWTSGGALAVLVPAGLAALALVRWVLGAVVAAAAGVVLLIARPDVSVRTAAALAGLLLIIGGVALLATRGRLVAIVAGAVILFWPSSTALVAGAFIVAAGLIAAAPGRWWRVAGGAVAVLLLVAGLFLQVPHPGSFYAAPKHLPSGHGVLVRSEPLTRGVPSSVRAWRILYTTTRGDGSATVASAVVMASAAAPPAGRPVLVWAHGASGDALDCAPSLSSDPVGDGSVPDLTPALAAGWVVIAPDYPGLGTAGPQPFLIGAGEARSVLDSVLAVHGLTALNTTPETLLWGHSQGGNAVLWGGIIAPSYAPGVDLAGVAALAPGTDLPALAKVWGDQIYAGYLIDAYSRTYPDVRFNAYVRATARLIVREQVGRCLDAPKVDLVGLSVLLHGQAIWSAAPDTGAFGDRLRQNIPDQHIGVPVLIAQGSADTTVPAAIQNGYVQRECTTGTQLDYRVYQGRDHVGIFTGDSPLLPELLQWSQDRLAGTAAESTC